MSATLDAWNELYEAQTEALGAITATLIDIGTNNPLATNQPAIPQAIALNQVLRVGGLSEAGQFQVQMRAADFGNIPPPKLTTSIAVSGGGADTSDALVVLDCNANGPIYYITAGDETAIEG